MRLKTFLSLVLGLSLVFSSAGANVVLATATDVNSITSSESNSVESVLAEQKAQNARDLAAAQADLAAYSSQSNSVRAQLDRLFEEDAASLEEYDRLSSELDMAMGEVEQSVRLYEDAQVAADEMQVLYEDRITTLFKYRNRSLLEVLLTSNSLNGFFTNLRLMSYIASADQRMLVDLKLAREDAAIAKDKAEEVAGQAEIYFDYVDEQLSRLKEDIDLIESDLGSLQQAILNRSADMDALKTEGELLNRELLDYYAEMAKLQEEAEASLVAEASEREATAEPEPIQVEESTVELTESLPEPTKAAGLSDLAPTLNTGGASSNAATSSERQTTTERPATTNRPTAERQSATTTEHVTTTERQTTTERPTTTERQTTTTERPTTTERQTTTERPTSTQPPTTTSETTTLSTTAAPVTTEAPPSTAGSSPYFLYPLISFQNDHSSYGPRVHPISGDTSSFHYGSDFSAPAGTPIRASMDGTVILVDKRWQGQTYTSHRSGYGNFVTIQHANGVSTTYAHMKFVTVESGQQVKQGDFIGQVGSTGASTGPHLHFEIAIYGSTVNPMGGQYLGSPNAIR